MTGSLPFQLGRQKQPGSAYERADGQPAIPKIGQYRFALVVLGGPRRTGWHREGQTPQQCGHSLDVLAKAASSVRLVIDLYAQSVQRFSGF
jgi:hypothetical protein